MAGIAEADAVTMGLVACAFDRNFVLSFSKLRKREFPLGISEGLPQGDTASGQSDFELPFRTR